MEERNSPNPSFRTSSAWRGEIRNPVQGQSDHLLSGFRLASAAGGLGRDDVVPQSLQGKGKTARLDC